jgi:peptide deformylase
MPIFKVARMGHPVLRAVSGPVTPKEMKGKWLPDFLEDMLETMSDYDGVGLAAPQVNVSKRIVIIGSPGSTRYPDAPRIPTMVLINPVIIPLTNETHELWEGCLSVPGLRGLVKRPRKIRVKALNEKGKKVEFIAEDFKAGVIQHETDHLDGILFPERMTDLKLLMFEAEYEKFHEPAETDIEEDRGR